MLINTTYALESAEASADGTARFLKNGTAMTPYYTIRDHLGSVRTIVNASGTVVERNDYYPFGTRTTFGTSYATLATNRQKFSGKEDQTTIASSTLPYLDFGARMYDPKLVRWNTYDPMAEKYYGINPYVYCAEDPINQQDPDGRNWYSYKDKDGSIKYHYVKGQLSKEEAAKNGYTDLGFTHMDESSGTYYSLFGNKLPRPSRDNADKIVEYELTIVR